MTTMEKHVIGHTEDGKEIVEVTRQIHTRKIDRKVINNQMKKYGLRQINKHDHSGPAKHQITVVPSYFAKYWRKYSSYDKK